MAFGVLWLLIWLCLVVSGALRQHAVDTTCLQECDACCWNRSAATSELGYCTLSKPGISRTLWPGNGKSFPPESHTHHRHTLTACAKFHRTVKAIRDRWERQPSSGKPHARGLEAITRCHNNTLRNLCALAYLLICPLPENNMKTLGKSTPAALICDFIPLLKSIKNEGLVWKLMADATVADPSLLLLVGYCYPSNSWTYMKF